MKTLIPTLALCLLLSPAFAQKQRKISLYLSFQTDITTRDITLSNNRIGLGPALQAYLHNKTNFKPVIDLNAALFGGQKILYLHNGVPLNSVETMVNLFGGASWHPPGPVGLSFTAGPGFAGGQTLFGIKPALGFFFPKSKKLTAKIAYLSIFNRGNVLQENFNAVSLSFGCRLF